MFVLVEKALGSIRLIIKKVLINIEASEGLASKASNTSALLLLKNSDYYIIIGIINY